MCTAPANKTDKTGVDPPKRAETTKLCIGGIFRLTVSLTGVEDKSEGTTDSTKTEERARKGEDSGVSRAC